MSLEIDCLVTAVYCFCKGFECWSVNPVSSLTVSYVCLSASPRHAHLLVSAHDRYGCYAPIHYPNPAAGSQPANQVKD
eukprot:jgi/Chrzof1/5427/Cz16g02180.t1